MGTGFKPALPYSTCKLTGKAWRDTKSTKTGLSNRVKLVQTLLQIWKIYLDTCCLNRPFNDQTQARICRETEAVQTILARFFTSDWQWVTSTVLVNEISKTPDAALRDDMEALLSLAHQNVSVGASEQTRCTQLKSLGFKWLDALHIACAESGGTDILLTTDDRMLRRAKRFHSQLRVRVENPCTWLEEIAEDEHTRSARS